MDLLTTRPLHRQSVVASERGLVTANHHLAAEAGAEVIGQGGNAPESTGGVTLLQALNLLEGFDLAGLEPLGAPALHLLLDSLHVAFVDRLAALDDPAFRPVPFGSLASKAFAAERRTLISADRALGEVEPGDPWPYADDRRSVMVHLAHLVFTASPDRPAT